MSRQSPQIMTQPEDTEYGRCDATNRDGDQCGRAAIGSHGKCGYHGGSSLSGEDSPSFEHGLFSDHLGEEDREAIRVLEEYDDEKKLDDIINWRLARLRRAVRAMNDQEDQMTFWEAFEEILAQTGEVEREEIAELAQMLDNQQTAMQMEIDNIRKLIKDRNKIAEGEDVNLGWREMLSGDGGE